MYSLYNFEFSNPDHREGIKHIGAQIYRDSDSCPILSIFRTNYICNSMRNWNSHAYEAKNVNRDSPIAKSNSDFFKCSPNFSGAP